MTQPVILIWDRQPFQPIEYLAYEEFSEFGPNAFADSRDFKYYWNWLVAFVDGYDLEAIAAKHGFGHVFFNTLMYSSFVEEGGIAEDCDWFTPRQLAEAATKILALIDEDGEDGRHLLEALWSWSHNYRRDKSSPTVIKDCRIVAENFRTLMEMYRDCEAEAAQRGIKRFLFCYFEEPGPPDAETYPSLPADPPVFISFVIFLLLVLRTRVRKLFGISREDDV